MPLLRDYIAEHERALNLGGEAVRALDSDDCTRAGELLTALAAELRSHWRGEEGGLFAVMSSDELFAAYIQPLVREHRELDALLQSVDMWNRNDRSAIRAAVSELYEHISKNSTSTSPKRKTGCSPRR